MKTAAQQDKTMKSTRTAQQPKRSTCRTWVAFLSDPAVGDVGTKVRAPSEDMARALLKIRAENRGCTYDGNLELLG